MPQIDTLIFEDGERFPIIRLDDHTLDYFPTLYTTENLRHGLAETSIRSVLRDIRHLQFWEEMEGRDLLTEIAAGHFPASHDFKSLRKHARYDLRELRKWWESELNREHRGVAVIGNRNGRMLRLPSVQAEHQRKRLRSWADYLSFSANALLRTEDDFGERFSPLILVMEEDILKDLPKGSSNPNPDHKAPPVEVFDQLLEITREDHPDNPFLNPDVRERNARMFDLLDETGSRAGAILALQVGDINRANLTVSIVRRPDNPDDPRPRQPTEKTQPRDIPVTQELIDNLWNYITKTRARTPGAKRHPYIFVNHHPGKSLGAPTSEANFRKEILGRVVATNEELFREVARHGFRHAANYRLSAKVDYNNRLAAAGVEGYTHIGEAQEMKIRKWLFGWKSDGSAAIYNQRHVQEQGAKLQREDMDKLSKLMKLKGIAV